MLITLKKAHHVLLTEFVCHEWSINGPAPASAVPQIKGSSPNPAATTPQSAPCNVVSPLTLLPLTLLHSSRTVDSNLDGIVQALSLHAQRVIIAHLIAFVPHINVCSATLFWLAASRLSVYRTLNVSRPALQIPMTPFLAFTFPHLPLTLRSRRIPLSIRRRGIWTGCRLRSLPVFGPRDSRHALLVRSG